MLLASAKKPEPEKEVREVIAMREVAVMVNTLEARLIAWSELERAVDLHQVGEVRSKSTSHFSQSDLFGQRVQFETTQERD
jgi:hypothetical protein